MKNENKHFTNISISFLILFIMKLIAQINILFLDHVPYSWHMARFCNSEHQLLKNSPSIENLAHRTLPMTVKESC